MKNVTKTNILFTFMATLYLLVIFTVRLLPPQAVGTNVRLILPEIVMLVPSLVYVTVLKPGGLDGMSFESPSFGNIVRIIIITVALLPFVSVLSGLSALFSENRAQAIMTGLTDNPLWTTLLLLAFVPAVCEEYVFRGLLFHGYKKRNPFRAMLMSSLLFGLIHLNVNQFLYAFCMGILFCLLVYATGTVVSSMAAHFIFNTCNVIMSYISADITVNEETYSGFVYIVPVLLTLAGLIVAFVVFRGLCRAGRGTERVRLILKRENRNTYREEEGKFFDGYIAVGIILCVAYMAVYGI